MSQRFVPRILASSGIIAILLGLLLNKWFLAALLTSDGVIGGPLEKLLINVFDISLILVGVGLIIWRRQPRLQRAFFFTIYLAIALLLFDFALHLAAPLLPQTLVSWMSPYAQRRYLLAHPEAANWIYDGPIRYGREGDIIDYGGQADRLGYRNPMGYLDEQGEIDILLLGDSFIWGTEALTIADHLRTRLPEAAIYSLGIPGEGISQWAYHYERFVAEGRPDATPEIVVLNFYSGNDITDTHLAIGLRESEGELRSIDYNAFINHQYLAPNSRRSFRPPKPPELLFISNYLLALSRAAPELQTEPEPITDIRQLNLFSEADPALVDEAIAAEIGRVVAAIRRSNPESHIIFSYIAPASVLYAEHLPDCAHCAHSLERQQQNSETLAGVARALAITFHDPTPALQAAAGKQLLWAETAHYSPAGYAAYATQLASLIAAP